MDQQRHCTCCERMLPPNYFPRDVGDCNECCTKRFLIEMFESPRSEQRYWKFRNWGSTVYDTKSLLEENAEFLHIEVLQKNLRITLGIKKKASKVDGPDDEYLIWIGDKQFVVQATALTPEVIEQGQDSGKVLSTHDAKARLE